VTQHTLVKHTDCEKPFCPICEGGLALCSVCGGAEGTLPTHYPGRRLTDDEEASIMNGSRDYEDGHWGPGWKAKNQRRLAQ